MSSGGDRGRALDCATLAEAASLLDPGVTVSFPGTGERLTAADLDRESERFAAGLVAAGVKPGEVVGLLLPTGPHVLLGLLGVVRAGAAASMLSAAAGTPERSAERLALVVSAARMRYLVVHEDHSDIAHVLQRMSPGLVVLDANLTAPPGRLPEAAEGDLALLQYTSGSTGHPKGVMLPHSAVQAALRAIVASARLTRQDIMVTWLPHYHDMGLFGLLAPLMAGASAQVLSPLAFIRRPARVLQLLSDHGGTLLMGPNFSYDRIVAAATPELLSNLDLSRWRLAFNGAEPVKASTVEAFTKCFASAGVPEFVMFPVYGMAEATLPITFPEPGTVPRIIHVDRMELSDHGRCALVASHHPAAKPLVSVGRPVQDMRLRLIDATGADCAPGQVGEIQISGPCVTSGYFANRSATAALFEGPWLHTGDLGFQLDGDLFIAGRIKEMIIVRGQNYFPEDVEVLAARQAGVHRGRCVAYAENEHVVVVAEIAPRYDPSVVCTEIRQVIADHLALTAVHVHPVRPGWLSRTTSGKWQRALTQRRIREQNTIFTSTDPDAPGD